MGEIGPGRGLELYTARASASDSGDDPGTVARLGVVQA
jgi:hypothetical protein